jgi:hypothetical protein
MTQQQWFLLPLFLHVLLIVWVGVRSLRARISSVLNRQTKLKDIALNSSAWPDEVLKFSNNYNNQFEFPTIWYAVSAFILITEKLDWICIGLSWAFLVARLCHTYVHVGSNVVPMRMKMFLASVIAVVAMWIWFAIRIFLIG